MPTDQELEDFKKDMAANPALAPQASETDREGSVACSELVSAEDTRRLEWLAEHEAMITRGKRAKTRRGRLAGDNLEDVWQIEWEGKDGSLIMQTPDGGHRSFRDAIDAAMKADTAPDQTLPH